jgi:hypothetical protein
MIEDIKQLVNKSSRFISLSGWSGIAAGIYALGSFQQRIEALEEINKGLK